MESTLGKLVIAVIVAVILMTTITMMYQGLLGKATEDTCRTSVLLRSAAVLDLGLFKSERLSPLVCSTFHEGNLKGNREQVKYQVADLMAKCWYMYAEGRVDNIFEDHEEESNMCTICYTFRIPNDMDTRGQLHQIEGDQFEDENYEREPNVIYSPELLGFLMEATYNKGVLYGGGTQRYIGASYSWSNYEFIFSEESTLRYSQVKRNPESPFIQDYAGFLYPDTQIKINDFAIKLNSATNADFFLVTAQEFNNIDRTAARRLTEQLNLNEEDSYNSFLVMTDLKNGVIRLHAGIELENYLLQEEIQTLLQKHFSKMSSIDDFNEAIISFIEELEEKFVGSDSNLLSDLGITRNSYFNYLTNRLQAPPPSITDIDSEYTYAIAVYSSKSENLRGFFDIIGDEIKYLGQEVSCLFKNGLSFDCFSWDTFFPVLSEYEFNNSVIVAPLNALSEECTVYN